MTDKPSIPPILDDLPTGHDALDFAPYVDALADILLDPNARTPLTMGVFGPWGSGKTSLMKMVQARLKRASADDESGGRQTHTVWFNAWLYSKEKVLWRALLVQVLAGVRKIRDLDEAAVARLNALTDQLHRAVGPAELGNISIAAAELLKEESTGSAQITLALRYGLDFLENMAQARQKGELAVVKALRDQVRRATSDLEQERIESLDRFQTQFETLLARYVLPRGYLVVFVDDLDRCLPDKAVEVLEAIKLFLDVPGCIFVLGLDPEAIERAVRTRYRGEVKAREYLEKIVQLPFILPPIEDEAMLAYVESLAPTLPDARCAEVFAQGLRPNPRQVKRTLNIFLLLSRLVEKRAALAGTITPVRLAKVVAIQHAHPDLYALLRLRPGYLRDLETFFRAGEEAGRMGAGEEGLPRLPEALEPFQGREELRLLLCLFEEEDARFDGLKPLEVRSYLTLARRATPVEAPAVHVARPPFEPELVSVPGGPFLMGTSDAQVRVMLDRFDWAKELKGKGWFDREQPQHEVTLIPFEIGRYPVTNAEYAAFVEATGHTVPRHWREGRFPEELADHPVVHVTWRDALAYVAWLRERTEQPYRLPSEAEWEKAARGEDGRLWPWGNDWDPARANCKPAGPGKTTPVGQYSPAGDSPYGAADVAGNVWEWCSSLWGDDPGESSFGYPFRADDGRENLETSGLRIMRGGSWRSDNPGIVRCAYRYGYPPVNWYVTLGFRVARGSLP